MGAKCCARRFPDLTKLAGTAVEQGSRLPGVLLSSGGTMKSVLTASVKIPPSYDHRLGLKASKVRQCRDTLFNNRVNDVNFGRVTHTLVPHGHYVFELLQLKKTLCSEDCLKELERIRSLFVGAQGLAFAIDNLDIPRNTLIVALDQPKSLHSEGIRSVRVPQYCRTKAGAVLDLGFFHGVWSAGTCMLAVTSPA